MTPTVAMFRSAESVAVSKLTDDMLVVRAHAEFDEMTATPLMVELLDRFEGLLDQYQTLEKLDRELANYGLDADDVEELSSIRQILDDKGIDGPDALLTILDSIPDFIPDFIPTLTDRSTTA